MAASQSSARITGVLFLLTFVTSIAALFLFQPVLDDPVGYIAGGGADPHLPRGILEPLLIVANIGTARRAVPDSSGGTTRPWPSATSPLASWSASSSPSASWPCSPS